MIARRANSHALISIHLNAFGDGVNPFPNVGTSTLFFHPQTEPLARLVQAGMMREMGLRDLGIHYQNIAIGRTMWMPSLICEGAFLMVPEQENAREDPANFRSDTRAASPTASRRTSVASRRDEFWCCGARRTRVHRDEGCVERSRVASGSWPAHRTSRPPGRAQRHAWRHDVKARIATSIFSRQSLTCATHRRDAEQRRRDIERAASRAG